MRAIEVADYMVCRLCNRREPCPNQPMFRFFTQFWVCNILSNRTVLRLDKFSAFTLMSVFDAYISFANNQRCQWSHNSDILANWCHIFFPILGLHWIPILHQMQDLSNNVGGGGEADAFIGHLGHNGDEARVCTRRISMSTFITHTEWWPNFFGISTFIGHVGPVKHNGFYFNSF